MIKKAHDHYSQSFDSLVYFGDGEWDYQACQNLGIPFIGVDHSRNDRLASLGATSIIHDFLDPEAVLDLLMN